jgi:hypothetical protein
VKEDDEGTRAVSDIMNLDAAAIDEAICAQVFGVG